MAGGRCPHFTEEGTETQELLGVRAGLKTLVFGVQVLNPLHMPHSFTT